MAWRHTAAKQAVASDLLPAKPRRHRHYINSSGACYLCHSNRLTWLTPTRDVIITLLIVNLSLVLVMVTMIAWQGYMLWQTRRHDVAGPVACASGVVVRRGCGIAGLGGRYLCGYPDRGLDTWFSGIRAGSWIRVTGAGCMAEQSEILRGDAITIVSTSTASVRILRPI